MAAVGQDKRGFVVESVETLSLFDLCWTAGFLEGEGSFYFTNGSYKDRQVVVFQVEWGPIIKLLRFFGGSVYPYYDDKRSAHRTPGLRWRLCGERAVRLMRSIYPLMSPKRQAQISPILEVI